MPTSVGVYDDSTLPAIIQSVNLLTPWVTTPVIGDFIGETKPFKQVPLLSWVVNLRETEIRATLVAYLKTALPASAALWESKIAALPDGYVNNVLANLGFGVTTLYQYSLLPRIDNIFSPSIYGAAPLWIGYYLFGALRTAYESDTSNDGVYRYKQLTDLMEITGYTLRTIITDSALTKGSHVIVAATVNSEERNVIYADNTNLSTYVDSGKTLNTLASQWISNKYNPSV